jgi:[ribosomal protein S5]-alanine N-acetyltransferase
MTAQNMQRVLAAGDLVLRPLRAEDAGSIAQWAGDKRIADTTANIPHPYPPELAQQWILETQDKWASGTDACFAITLAETAELVGAISLMDIADGEAELGYWVGAPWWGRGIASRAAELLIEFAGKELQLARLHARCLARNPASSKVLLRSGFVYLKTEQSVCGFQQENQPTEFFERVLS